MTISLWKTKYEKLEDAFDTKTRVHDKLNKDYLYQKEMMEEMVKVDNDIALLYSTFKEGAAKQVDILTRALSYYKTTHPEELLTTDSIQVSDNPKEFRFGGAARTAFKEIKEMANGS